MAENDKTDDLLNQTPPHNIDIEKALLASLMSIEEAYDKIADIVTKDDFYAGRHQYIFDAVAHLAAVNEPYDTVMVHDWLEAQKLLKGAGGDSYLADILSQSPATLFNLTAYAQRVRELSTLRQLITTGNDMLTLAYNPKDQSVSDILDNVEGKIFSINEQHNKRAEQRGPVGITSVLTNVIDKIQVRADELIAAGAINKAPIWQTIDINANDVDMNALKQIPQLDGDSVFIILNIPCVASVVGGQINIANSAMVAQQLDIAHQLAVNETVAAIITGPLQKSALIDADIKLLDGTMFSGHTEFFMQQSGCDKVVMMLANQAMKVALVTTHLALKDIPAAITVDNVRQTVQIVIDDMREKFGLAQPRILVCGLNPHAGEGGHLGSEEIDIINPVLQEFIDAGVNISEAMPADTLFTSRHLANCDAVIAMYHDQGLPVLKSHGFGDTVNLTLGLPYIRTSVDHGTALDLAGRGGASATSLYQALNMANEMADKSLTS